MLRYNLRRTVKQFSELSGPWTGLSVQDGRRIAETIVLHIRGGAITGHGFDVDGDIFWAHEFNNANNVTSVYMSTAKLPVRYELRTASAVAGSWTRLHAPWLFTNPSGALKVQRPRSSASRIPASVRSAFTLLSN